MEKTFAKLKNINNPDRWNYAVAMEMFGKDAVEYLHSALSGPNKWVRYFAANSLGNIGDPRSVEPLVMLLSDEDQDVRTSVASALGKIGGPTANRALIQAYAGTNCYVKIFIEAVTHA